MSSPRSYGQTLELADITGVATIPTAIAESGTCTKDTHVATAIISDGSPPTSDFSVVKEGDYVLINGEVRKVKVNHTGLGNNPRIDVVTAFTGAHPVGDTWKLVKNKLYNRVRIKNTGSAAGLVNGQALAAGDVLDLESDQGLEVILVDGSSTHLQVTVSW